MQVLLINIFVMCARIQLGKSIVDESFPSREIVIFRGDVLEKACCNAYRMPTNEQDIPMEVFVDLQIFESF